MSAPRYQIVLVRPEGFIHVEALREIMEAFQEGFRALGQDVPIRVNGADHDATALVFAGQHLEPGAASVIPEGAIFYNAEQLAPGYPWALPRYLSFLDRHEVWDFSARNVALLAARPRTRPVLHAPVPYSPTLTRIPRRDEDIDLLFIGRLNERRRAVLQKVADRGLNVRAVVGLYGAERDALIARSKAVLNVHVAAHGSFESARVVYLLANRKAVICESTDDADVEEDLRGSVMLARYEDLADACVLVARDAALRERLSEAGHAAVKTPARRAEYILERLLAARSR